jgi:membrane-bound metal-dependent hydrolase YbcI (DUF457 family)
LASPLAHGLVGVGAAAAVAYATGIPPSPTLWVGSVIFSGLPDLDFAVKILGLSRRSFHRQATHSLVVLATFIVVVFTLWGMFGGNVDINLVMAWSAALFSHPVLDAITTDAALAARGAGIPLLWPVHSRRWFLQFPIPTVNLFACSSLTETYKGLLRENVFFGVVTFVLVLLCYVS